MSLSITQSLRNDDDSKKLNRWVIQSVDQRIVIDHRLIVTMLLTISWISFKNFLE